MKQSITYYVTLFVLRLKGIKKIFSNYPIDYIKIRREDIKEPKSTFYKKNIIRKFNILKSRITEIGIDKNSKNLIIFIHGGAFISGPAKHHWDTIKEIARRTNQKIWMCDYPKSPESKIDEISKNIDAIYKLAIQTFKANDISIIGDSVGGTLATSLIQRLISTKIELPSKLILVSPVMDSSLSNPKVEEIENKDPMLSKKGVLSAKEMCAGKIDLKDKIISPLYGEFKDFPSTFLFISKNDITCADAELTVIKMKKSKIKTTVIYGENMPHIWPFLPFMKEAKMALNQIIRIINN